MATSIRPHQIIKSVEQTRLTINHRPRTTTGEALPAIIDSIELTTSLLRRTQHRRRTRPRSRHHPRLPTPPQPNATTI